MMLSAHLQVRPYQPEDREELLQIGAETAFFGAPIEQYMEDRRIFMDAFYAYYTDCEPQHAWCACAEGRVVGFLTGCTDTTDHDQTMQRTIIPRVAWNWLRGYYHPGLCTWRYFWAVLGAAARGEFPGVDLTRYPAHLHINLLPAYRGIGLGSRLMQAYLEQLRDLGVRGVHLHTTSQNTAATRLYEKTGFQLLAARPTHLYDHLLEVAVANLCYGLEL